MSLFEVFLIGIGLSMDAFAVSICKGLAMKKVNKKQALVIGLFFGGFQSLMPFIGWAVGSTFADKITKIDHWVCFILLAYIGGKMLMDAIKEWKDNDVAEVMDPPLDIKELFIMAIATSIDALAVGITFSFIENFAIVSSITLIGVTTFTLSIVGVYIGNIFGSRYKAKATLIGGLILIGIGIKILAEHLFF